MPQNEFSHTIPPKFWPNFSVDLVAEWSKASDYFRSFGQKMKWGPGKNFFFTFFTFFI